MKDFFPIWVGFIITIAVLKGLYMLAKWLSGNTPDQLRQKELKSRLEYNEKRNRAFEEEQRRRAELDRLRQEEILARIQGRNDRAPKREQSEKEREEGIRRAGEEGEKHTRFYLSWLPKGFSTIHNIKVYDGDHTAEIDHIVVGPYGIVLVETKNHGGTIVMRTEGWVQEKTIEGRVERKSMDSPIAQSKRHLKVFERFLSSNDFGDVPVKLIVAFGKSAILEGRQDPEIPVIKAESLPEWIERLPAKVTGERLTQLQTFMQHLKSRKCSGARCAVNYPDGVKECVRCGAGIVTPAFCPGCGSEVQNNREFCGECSRPLEDVRAEMDEAAAAIETEPVKEPVQKPPGIPEAEEITEKLARLHNLHQTGAITGEEYQALKQKIIAG